MKHIIKYTALVILTGLLFTGCYKDIIPPTLAVDPDGPPQPVSFSTELAPLFNSSCAIAGCHVSGAHHPYMTTDVSYREIVNNGYVNLALPKQSTLYIMVNGEMSQYIPSQTDKQKVYDWIRNGAPNN